jgi:2-keto-4-pentenoate hydratase/2-oxohepta-3-ene-1,7-dioic acid hydratase in catechol pathway
MKLISFSIGSRKSCGLWVKGGVIDLQKHLGQQASDLKSLIANGLLDAALHHIDAPVDYDEADISFLPLIGAPNKIICVGMNYTDKRREFEQTNEAPTLFIRFPDSQTGHGCALVKPSQSEAFDYEGELALVIGKGGSCIPAARAYEHIAGYSCYMDGSVRDWQHSWFTAGKNWRQTGAFGHCLVTADEIPDPHALSLTTTLNGRIVQKDNTGNMVHKIPELIEYISTFSELSPGDVIITGSPGDAGQKRNPPLFLKADDVIEVEIEKVGRLRNVAVCSVAA